MAGQRAARHQTRKVPVMSLHQPEPVEISTRMREGEWTEDTLADLVNHYQEEMRSMGAPVEDTTTDIEKNDDGSLMVAVRWTKSTQA